MEVVKVTWLLLCLFVVRVLSQFFLGYSPYVPPIAYQFKSGSGTPDRKLDWATQYVARICLNAPEKSICPRVVGFICGINSEECETLFAVVCPKHPGSAECLKTDQYKSGSGTPDRELDRHILDAGEYCLRKPEDSRCPAVVEHICGINSKACEALFPVVCPIHPGSAECLKNPQYRGVHVGNVGNIGNIFKLPQNLLDLCSKGPHNKICPRVLGQICENSLSICKEYAGIICPKHPNSTECIKFVQSFFPDRLHVIDVCYNASEKWICSFLLKTLCEVNSGRCELFAEIVCPKHSVSECLKLHAIPTVPQYRFPLDFTKLCTKSPQQKICLSILAAVCEHDSESCEFSKRIICPKHPEAEECSRDPHYRSVLPNVIPLLPNVIPLIPNVKTMKPVYNIKNLTDLCSETPENRVCPRILTNICTFESETCQKYIPIVCPKHPKSFGCLKLYAVIAKDRLTFDNPVHVDYLCTKRPTYKFCPKMLKKFCEPDDETCEEFIVNVCSRQSESEECVKYFPKWRESIEFPIDDIIKGLAE